MDTSMNVPHVCYVVQEMNKQRLTNTTACDFALISNGQKFYAHKGVLVAVSPYFKTKFKDCYRDSSNSEEELPPIEGKHVQVFMEYVYTGSLFLDDAAIEDILTLADYLCVEDLKTKCGQYLLETLNKSNCLWVKFLADRFSVTNVQVKVIDFMSPIFDEIIQEDDAMLLPVNDLVCLLEEEQLNYVHEYLLWDLVASWIKWDPETRTPLLEDLIPYLNPSYIDPERLSAFTRENEGFARILLPGAEIHDKRDSMQDVIVIRGRQLSRGDPVNLMIYSIQNDSWKELDYNRDWLGLESMVSHDGILYAMSKLQTDVCGYMHKADEKHELVKIFPAGLVTLNGPRSLKGQTRLISFLGDLIAVDAYGTVEIYEPRSNDWYPLITSVSLAPCQYFLPMPFDHTLYLLRATYYSETELDLTLHEMDLKSRSSRLVSECTTSDLNLDPDERYHGYSITSSAILVQNEMGRPRIKYDLTADSWSTLPRHVPYLRCISDVWGSTSCGQRSYYVCRMKGSNNSSLLMHDFPSGKIKALSKPLRPLSGVMCNLRLNIQDFVDNGTVIQ